MSLQLTVKLTPEEEDKRLFGYQRILQAKAEQGQSSSQTLPMMQNAVDTVAPAPPRIRATNLIVGVALIIVGSLFFFSSVTMPHGCDPGSLLNQAACDYIARIRLLQMWLEGTSSFAVALVILSVGRIRMSRLQSLEATVFMYAGLPLLLFLFLTMLFTGQAGDIYVAQQIIFYYLVAVIAGLLTVFGHTKEFGRTRSL